MLSYSGRGKSSTSISRAPQRRSQCRCLYTRRQRWARRRRRRRIIDAHFPPNNLESLEHLATHPKRRNTPRLECLLIHSHHFLLRHTFEIRRVLVQPERAQPPRHVVQHRGVKTFFVLRSAVPCGSTFITTITLQAACNHRRVILDMTDTRRVLTRHKIATVD
ncbi:hypothetical protein EI94DRAFT_1755185, partial [Lactarius quietus]